MVHLPGEVPHRDAALGLAQPGRAGAQPLGHGPEQSGERADLVAPVARERDVEAVHVDPGGALGERRERSADPQREPAGEQQGDGAREGERHDKPAVHIVAQRVEPGERVGHDDARRHEPCRVRRDRRHDQGVDHAAGRRGGGFCPFHGVERDDEG